MMAKKLKKSVVVVFDERAWTFDKQEVVFKKEKKVVKAVLFPKDARVKCGDILLEDWKGNSSFLVTGVQSVDDGLLVSVLKCFATVSVRRVGKYRYPFFKPDTFKDGWLTVCLRQAVYTVLSDLVYDWNKNKYRGEADFLMSKCDVRPLDTIVLEYGTADKNCKYYSYQVDTVCNSEYEGVIRVRCSAENRKFPTWVQEFWSDYNA